MSPFPADMDVSGRRPSRRNSRSISLFVSCFIPLLERMYRPYLAVKFALYPDAAPLRQTTSPFPTVSNLVHQSKFWLLVCADRFESASNDGSRLLRVLRAPRPPRVIADCRNNKV